MPTLAVEAAFGVDPGTAPTPTQWTDLSAYVSEFHISSGRSTGLERFEAGECRLVFTNADGRFDPDNTAGPYTGNVRPMVRVRVRASHDGAGYDLFTGFVDIDGWVNTYRHPEDATAAIRCVDAFEVLAQTHVPSAWEQEVRGDSPRAWWRLGEPSGTTVGDTVGNYDGTYLGGATFNTRTGLAYGDTDNGIGFDGVDDSATLPDEAIDTTDSTGSVELLVKTTQVPASGTRAVLFHSRRATGALRDLCVYLESDGKLGVLPAAKSSVVVNDDATHHVVLTVTGGVSTVYVDGVNRTAAGAITSEDVYGTFLGGWAGMSGSPLVRFSGILDDVALFDGVLTATQVTDHYNAVTDPWDNDLSGTRVGRILDWVGFPLADPAGTWRLGVAGQSELGTTTVLGPGDRQVDDGQTRLQEATLNTSALEHLQAVEQAETGSFYVDHHNAGRITFRERHALLNDTRSNTAGATFGDGTGEVPYSDVVFDRTPVRNVVGVARSGGSRYVAEDATSKARYLIRKHEVSGLIHRSDTESRYKAQYLLDLYKEPARRVRGVILEPTTDAHPAWAQVLGRRIGDRVTVKRRPAYGGTISQDVIVEGIRHSWVQSAKRWTTTYALSPTLARTYWRLGVTSASELGTTTRLSY